MALCAVPAPAALVDGDTLLYLNMETSTVLNLATASDAFTRVAGSDTRCTDGQVVSSRIQSGVSGTPADNAAYAFRSGGAVASAWTCAADYDQGDFTYEEYIRVSKDISSSDVADHEYIAYRPGVWMVRIESDFSIKFNYSPWTALYRTDPMNDGKWHHVAVVQNKSLGTLTAYFDHRVVASVAWTVPATQSSTSFFIGAYSQELYRSPKNVAHDETRVTKRALRASEMIMRPEDVGDYEALLHMNGNSNANASGRSDEWRLVSGSYGDSTDGLVAPEVYLNGTNGVATTNAMHRYGASGAYLQFTNTVSRAESYVFGDFTFEMLFRSPDGGNVSGYGSYLAWQDHAWMLQFNEDGSFGLKDSSWQTKIWAVPICDGRWHHVAFVQDRTAGTWKLYVDHRLQGTCAYVVPADAAVDGLLDITSWHQSPQLKRNHTSVDEVRLTPVALTPDRFVDTLPFAEERAVEDALLGPDALVSVTGSRPLRSGGADANELNTDGSKPALTYAYSTLMRLVATNGLESVYGSYLRDSGSKTNRTQLCYDGLASFTMSDRSYLQNDFTVEFFFRIDDAAKLCRGNFTDAYLIQQAGVFYWRVANSGNLTGNAGGQDTWMGLNVADGRFHHYAVTWEKAAKTLRLYYDQKPFSSRVLETDVCDISVTEAQSPLYIGRTCWGADSHSVNAGCLDELRITQKCLKPTEFLAARRYPVDAGTLAYLDMEDPSSAKSMILAPTNGLTVQFAENVVQHGGVYAATNFVAAPRILSDAAGGFAVTNAFSMLFDFSALSDGNKSSIGGGYIFTDSDRLLGSDSFTVEMSFMMDTIPQPYYGCLLNHGGAWRFEVTNLGYPIVYFNDGSSTSAAILDQMIVDGAWHHLAVVYDKPCGTLSFFIDHRAVKRYANVAALAGNPTTLHLGGRNRAGNATSWWAFDGCVTKLAYDSVRIENRALRATEFLALSTLPADDVRLWGRFEGASPASGTPAGAYALTAETEGDVVLKRGPQARPARCVYTAGTSGATTNAYGAYLNGGTLTYRGEGVLDLPTATVEFFVRGAGTGAAPVATLQTGTTALWSLTADGRFTLVPGGTSVALSVSPFDGRWHHVAVVTEESGSETAVRVFVDHELVGSLSLGAKLSFAQPASLVFGSAAFAGGLDEVRVTKTALPPARMMACDPPTGLSVIVR